MRPEPQQSTPRSATTAAPEGCRLRIGLVTSRYHSEITAALRDGARQAFQTGGGRPDDLVEADAPGSFELVAVCLAMARRSDIDAVVALGLVLTGQTSHDRYICEAVSQGLVNITLQTGKPVAFGVLTCETMAQAQARSGGSHGNKGIEAMNAALAAAWAIKRLVVGGR